MKSELQSDTFQIDCSVECIWLAFGSRHFSLTNPKERTLTRLRKSWAFSQDNIHKYLKNAHVKKTGDSHQNENLIGADTQPTAFISQVAVRATSMLRAVVSRKEEHGISVLDSWNYIRGIQTGCISHSKFQSVFSLGRDSSFLRENRSVRLRWE